MPESMRQARDIRRAAIELDAEPPRKWAGPGEVVVSRTDLEEAIVALESLTDDVVWGEMIERLSAVLNTENQT